MEKITCDTIINWLQKQVETKQPISPSVWVDSAEKLNILLSDEESKHFELAQKVAQMRVALLEEGKNVSEVKVRIEATDEYREMNKQKAKINRIIEHIRLAKLQSRMAVEEARGSF